MVREYRVSGVTPNHEQSRQLQEKSPAFARIQALSEKKIDNLDVLEKSAAELRQRRHKAWLKAVFDSHFDGKNIRSICHTWSTLADEICQKACDLISEGQDHGQPVLLALGKWGAQELNLSSDIDLIFIFPQESEKNAIFLRRFQKLVGEVSDFGFCFRLDYDLRPGGRFGSLAVTVDQMEDYYGNYGETWERLAMTRIRCIWGPKSIEKQVVGALEKFTFRKFLDFTVMEDLKILRTRVHEEQIKIDSQEKNSVHLKLGRGGIRDIELFIHSLQVIHGGKRPELRTHSTTKAIEKAQELNLLSNSDAIFLQNHYWNLRRVENLVQSKEDQQTHRMYDDFPDYKSLISEMQHCDHLVAGLLGEVSDEHRQIPTEIQTSTPWLLSLGASVDTIENIWPQVFETRILSRNKERDIQARQRFLHQIVTEFSKKPQGVDQGLPRLVDFLKAIRAKSSFFSLLVANRKLISDLASIFMQSQPLSNLLIFRPELLDNFLFQQDQKDFASSEEALQALLDRKLLGHLRAGIEFLTHQDIKLLNQNMSALADQIILELLRLADPNVTLGLEIVALGKWGGEELGLHSDLDFIFVCQKTSPQLIKTARQIISWMTGAQRGGSLYSIDLRLKPQQGSGPLIVEKSELLEFLKSTAPAWERQAYLRARPLTEKNFRDKILSACLSRPLTAEDLQELQVIQRKLQQTNLLSTDIKTSAGALIDIEFATQITFLKHNLKPFSPATVDMILELGAKQLGAWKSLATDLADNYAALRKIEQMGYAGETEKPAKQVGLILDKTQQLLRQLDPRQLEG